MHVCATVGNGTYTYYVRKHNGLIVFDSVANVTDRALRIRNCGCPDSNSRLSPGTKVTLTLTRFLCDS